jgi:hypothetical protein
MSIQKAVLSEGGSFALNAGSKFMQTLMPAVINGNVDWSC